MLACASVAMVFVLISVVVVFVGVIIVKSLFKRNSRG
jgi:hypothetical protein